MTEIIDNNEPEPLSLGKQMVESMTIHSEIEIDSMTDGTGLTSLEATVLEAQRQSSEALSSEGRQSFSTKIPNLQIAWDSTSLNDLKKCPRYYQYSMVLGYGSPFANAHLTFGGLFAKSLETYNRLMAKTDSDHEKALIEVIRFLVSATWDSEINRPWVSDEPTKSRDTLLRTVIWYLDFFKTDSLKTLTFPDGTPAVEVPFRLHLGDIDLFAPSGEEFLLCGYLDKIVIWNDGIYIVDQKTTKSPLDDTYFKQYNPHNQMTLYSIAGKTVLEHEIDGVIIDAAQILVEGTRFRRRPIPRSTEQLEEWLVDLKYYLKEAITYAIDNHWPMRESSCGFGRNQCTFRPVCSADPSARQEMLDSFYVRRIWNPLETR